MTTPTVPFEWATAALVGDITAPPSGVRLSGYGFEDQFNHDEFNYLLNALGQWTGHLAGTGKTFQGLTLAQDSGLLSATESFTLLDSGIPLGLVQDVSGSTSTRDVSTNGPYTLILDTTGQTLIVEDTGVTAVAAGTANSLRVAAGPTHWAIIDNTAGTVKCYTYAGVLDWTYTHGSVLTDVAVDVEQVYITGTSGTNADGTGTHRAIDIATGLEVWTQAWGATLNCVYVTGSTVIVGGNVSGGFYAAEISRDTGVLIRNVGGGAAVAGKSGFYTDGHTFYMMTSGGLYVCPYNTLDMTSVTPLFTTGKVYGDDRFIYVIENSILSAVLTYPKGNPGGAQVRIRPQVGSATIRGMCTNGHRVFVGYDLVSGDVMSTYRTTAINKRYVYKDPTAGEFLPTGSLYCPETIQY